MEKTKSYPNLTLAEELCLTTQKKKEVFSQIMHSYTGGIPRFVLLTFQTLIGLVRKKGKKVLSTKKMIETIFQNDVRNVVEAKMSTSLYIPTDGRLRSIYSFMINLYLSNQALEGNMSIRINQNERTPILDIIASLALHVEPAGENKYRIVFSRYVVDILAKCSASLLIGLLKSAKELPTNILSQPNMLLYLVAEKIVSRLNSSKSFSQIPGFSSSILAREDINTSFCIQYIPSFNSSVKDASTTFKFGEQTLVHNYSPANWDSFVANLTSYGNVFGIPYDDNSHGPDAIISITKELKGEQKVVPFLIMFAFKNFQNESALEIADLFDETQKCLENPRRDHKVQIPLVLFVVATKLSKALQDSFQGGDFLIFNARHCFTKDNV